MLLTWSLRGHSVFLVIFEFDVHMCLKNETVWDFMPCACWWQVMSCIFFIQVRISCVRSNEDRSKDHQARETLYRDQLRPSHSRKEISFQEGLVLLAFLVLQRHRYKTAALSRAVWEEITNSSWFSMYIIFLWDSPGKERYLSFELLLAPS